MSCVRLYMNYSWLRMCAEEINRKIQAENEKKAQVIRFLADNFDISILLTDAFDRCSDCTRS